MPRVAKKVAEQIDEIVARPYTVEVVYGEAPEEGVLARIAEWPGCLTAGDTRAEALSKLEDAMRDWAGSMIAVGDEVPEPLSAFNGSVLLRMPRSLHRDVAKRAETDGVSMNQWIATTVARAVGDVANGESRKLSEAKGRYRTTPRRTAGK